MKYRSFGRTGIKVSNLILGTWYLPNHVVDGKRKVDENEAVRLIQRAYDSGINFFDTADVYRGVYDRENMGNFDTTGQSETILGKALKGYDRESYVVSTKVMGKVGPLLNDSGANRKHVRNAIRKSLERLQMDYVDFYIIHAPDEATGFVQSARTMNILQDEGLMLHYGLSNFSPHELIEFLNVDGYELPDFIQDKYNLVERQQGENNIKIAERNSMASMVYSPLAQGVLAGRYLQGDESNSRNEYEKLFNKSEFHDKNKEALQAFGELAFSRGVSMAQLSLAWLIQSGNYTFPIIGATKVGQFEDSLGSADLRLTRDDVLELERLFNKREKSE